MKGALALRSPVGSPIVNDNSGANITALVWATLGTIEKPASAMEVYNSSSKAIKLSDGARSVHSLSFSATPDEGSITLNYGTRGTTGALAYTQADTDLTTLLEAIFGAGNVVATGSFAAGFVIYYNGYNGDVALPTNGTNTLKNTNVAVTTTYTKTKTGVVQTWVYIIPPSTYSSIVPNYLKAGSIYALAVGSTASTGFVTINFLA